MTTIKDYKFDRDGNLIPPTDVCENIREVSHTNEYSNKGRGGGYIGNSVPNNNTSHLEEQHQPTDNYKELHEQQLTTLTTVPPDDTDGEYSRLVAATERFLKDADFHDFTLRQFDEAIGLEKTMKKAMKYRTVIFSRLKDSGRLERISYARYREVKTNLIPVNWQDANISDILKLNYPLDMERIIKTYKGSILVCAGVSHSGKTALAYNFLLKNMNNPLGVHLFTTTDMDDVEIKERMIKSGFIIPNPAPFYVWELPPEPSDLIQKDAINILDYVDLNSELYMIGDILEKIQAKLGRGFAWVNIQKKGDSKLGTGGQFSIKRSKIYLSLDTVTESGNVLHKVTIEKCRGRTKPDVNPYGHYYKFKLADGIKIQRIEEG